ncbi:hypothetical protein SBRCBS47491_005876 [Sporothrix bragantina]|uniref:Uncharacterized protein n=1 Tax=Sporothrix bragantina TaxID=671064 RepID=A0ABP0C085_9PEZI
MASPLSGPGVFWISSNTNDETIFAYDDFVRWYEDVHISDMINADPEHPLPVARRYQALSPTERPFLVVYRMTDLAIVAGEAFRKVPLHHETLPGGGPIAQYAHFRGRFAGFVKAWGSPGKEGTLLISEVTEAMDELRYEEYMASVQSLPGWLRSSQYTIIMENDIGRDKPPPSGPPTAGVPPAQTRWLTLHEFDGTQTVDSLAMDRVAARSTTVPLGSAGINAENQSKVEVQTYRLVRTYGNGALMFADTEAESK